MSSSPSFPFAFLVLALFSSGLDLSAGTITKANNTTNLDQSGSWVGGVLPGAADAALWNSTVTGSNSVSLGTNRTFGQIQVSNPAGAVTLNNNTLTLNGLGGIGINMGSAAQNLTINSAVTLGASQNWDVAASRTLTVGGVVGGGFALNKDGSGQLTLNGANTFSGGLTVNSGTVVLGNNTAAGSGAISINSAGVLNISGRTLANTISGSGTLESSTSGSATLNGSLSAFSGTINAAASSGGTNKVNINNGSTSSSSATANVVSGGTLYVSGSGTNWAGITNVSGVGNGEGLGALRVETTVSGNVNLTGNTSIGSSSTAGTISGSVGDGGSGFSITKTGGQTLSLTNANTYSGTTTVSQGTLSLTGSGTLSNTSEVVVSGGTFSVGDTAASSNKISTSAGLTLGGPGGGGTFTLVAPSSGTTTQTFASLTVNPGNHTINNTNGAGTLTFNGIAGSGYHRNGGGILNFTVNTAGFGNAPTAVGGSSVTSSGTPSNDILIGAILAGTNFVQAGAGNLANANYSNNSFGPGLNSNLTASASTGAANTQSLRFTGTQTLTLTGTTTVDSGGLLNGGTGTSVITAGTLQAVAGQNLWVFGNSGNNLTISSTIADNGGSGLEKFGGNTLNLTGSNTFSGQVWLSGGILTLGHTNALGTGTANLNFAGSATLQANTNGLSIGRTIVLHTGQNATFNTNGRDMTISGGITSSTPNAAFGATMTKTGAGKLILSGTNMFTTPININNSAGEIEFTGANTLTGNLGTAGATTAGNGIFTFSGNSTFNLPGDWNFGTTSGNFVTMNIRDNAAITLGARLFLGKATNGTAVGNQTGGTLTTNQLDLNNDNFTGTSNVYNLDGGALQTPSVVLGGGGVLNLNGGTLRATGNAGSWLTQATSTVGTVVVKAGGAIIDTQTFNVTATASVPLQHDSALGSSPDGGLTKLGSGTLTLSGLNTYTGPTNISAGTITAGIAQSGASGSLGNNSAVTLANTSGAGLNLAGFNTTIGSLAGGGSSGGNVSLGAATLTIGGNNGSVASYAGVLSGAGGLIRNGTGKQALSGVNTYTGATTVNGGYLQINGTGSINSTSGVTVESGAALQYNSTTGLTRNVTLNGGTFRYNSSTNYSGTLTFGATGGNVGGSNLSGQNLTISTGRTLSPGNSTGTLSAGNTIWADGGTFEFELNDAAGIAGSTSAGWDLLAPTTLSITAGAGQFTFKLISLDATQSAGIAQNFNEASATSWLFADAGATITGFNAAAFTLDTSAFQNSFSGAFSLTQGAGVNDDKLYLNYTPIPEPSAAGMILLGILGYLRRKTRRTCIFQSAVTDSADDGEPA